MNGNANRATVTGRYIVDAKDLGDDVALKMLP
jgi:hypothetical protein